MYTMKHLEHIKQRKRSKLARVLGGKNGKRHVSTRKRRNGSSYRRIMPTGVVSTRLTKQQLKQVTALCKASELNMSVVVRFLIEKGLESVQGKEIISGWRGY